MLLPKGYPMISHSTKTAINKMTLPLCADALNGKFGMNRIPLCIVAMSDIHVAGLQK